MKRLEEERIKIFIHDTVVCFVHLKGLNILWMLKASLLVSIPILFFVKKFRIMQWIQISFHSQFVLRYVKLIIKRNGKGFVCQLDHELISSPSFYSSRKAHWIVMSSLSCHGWAAYGWWLLCSAASHSRSKHKGSIVSQLCHLDLVDAIEKETKSCYRKLKIMLHRRVWQGSSVQVPCSQRLQLQLHLPPTRLTER